MKLRVFVQTQAQRPGKTLRQGGDERLLGAHCLPYVLLGRIQVELWHQVKADLHYLLPSGITIMV